MILNKTVFKCDSCGLTFEKKEDIIIDDNDEILCKSCYKDFEKAINQSYISTLIENFMIKILVKCVKLMTK